VTIYSITTNFDIGMHPYSDFQCTKFQGNRLMHFWFITTFTPLQKEEKEEKNEETKPIFEGSFLRNAMCNLVEFWNVSWWHWQAFPLQKLFCFVKVSQSYVYMKIVFLFFLLIIHWCGAVASWAARHTTVCLDMKGLLISRVACPQAFLEK